MSNECFFCGNVMCLLVNFQFPMLLQGSISISNNVLNSFLNDLCKYVHICAILIDCWCIELVCVRACACVRACVRVCVRACMCVRVRVCIAL